MQGRIIKGIAGFYYVYVVEAGVYECKAKGIFRKDSINPLVGDMVEIDVTDDKDMEGNITKILPRKNSLVRPAVANVDQAVVIFAARQPDINFHLLNSFLVWMEMQQVPSIIIFNKADLIDDDFKKELLGWLKNTGYSIIFTSAKSGEGISELRIKLGGKISTVAGPSGAGKSSLINLLLGTEKMETGSLSKKTSRGKHTTRHSAFLKLDDTSFIMDTPGFSSIVIPDMEKEDVGECFPEFSDFMEGCRFSGCSHISEPGCAVRQALTEEKISQERYEEYKYIYEDIRSRKKY